MCGRVKSIEKFTFELGCKVRGLSSTYMVLSLGTPFRLVIVRDGVEERLFMYLKGGRLM